MFGATISKRKDSEVIKIRILIGGQDGNQDGPLKAALLDPKVQQYHPVQVELLYNKYIRENNMDEEMIATYLADCDVYIIATHAHQGLDFISAPKVTTVFTSQTFNI